MPNFPKSNKRPWAVATSKPQGGRKVKTNFYHTPEWRKVRKIHISENPLCVECKREGKRVVGNVADHIKQINRVNPFNTVHGMFGEPLSLDNLQTLCTHHHAVKSGKERQTK